MTDFDDELSGIFDNLKPEDFAPFQGRVAFDQFITQNIETTRISWMAADGAIAPVAVLATAHERWTIIPTDDENLGEYLNRVREEARKVHATWLYISRKTLVGNYVVNKGDEVPDATNAEAVAEALEKGILSEGVFYYAERFENGQRDCRHGLMRSEGARLGELVEGNPQEQVVSIFSNMLG